MEEDQIEQTIQVAKTIIGIGDLSGVSAGIIYQQAVEEAKELPEGLEREAAMKAAWNTFARANQRAHEQEREALRKLLDKA
jgi:hypothetical protein